LSHQPFLLLTTCPTARLGFNKFNGLASRQNGAREPLLARCDNAPPTRTARTFAACLRRSRTLSRRWPPRATHCTLSVYGSEIRPMSAHGGSNSWNLSPSALTPPGWGVGPNRPIKRPRSPAKAKGRQRAAGPPAAGPARRSSSGPHFACARERRLKSLAAAPRSDLPSWAPASRWSDPPLSDG
jgi:hypothetical protein